VLTRVGPVDVEGLRESEYRRIMVGGTVDDDYVLAGLKLRCRSASTRSRAIRYSACNDPSKRSDSSTAFCDELGIPP